MSSGFGQRKCGVWGLDERERRNWSKKIVMGWMNQELAGQGRRMKGADEACPGWTSAEGFRVGG